MKVVQTQAIVGEDRMLKVPLPPDAPVGLVDVLVVMEPRRPITPEERRAAAEAGAGALRGIGLTVDGFLAERRQEERRGDQALGL